MSISNIQKLQGVGPQSPLTARGETEGAKGAQAQGQNKPIAAPSSGVNVEVSQSIDAGSPPVSSERVAEIRAALRDGSYPLVPAEIADAMIAARISMGIDN